MPKSIRRILIFALSFLYVCVCSIASAQIPPADWIGESNQASSMFGKSLWTADVNGDGCQDLLVGASSYDTHASNDGAIFLYYGSASGLPPSANWSFAGFGPNDALAFTYLSGLPGDINGDGYDELAAISKTGGILFHGSAAGPASSPDWIGPVEGGGPSHSGGAFGDVNGDGYDDLILGEAESNNGYGAAFLYYGSATGLSASYGWEATSVDEGSWFGRAVTSGDFDNDGYDDLVVGAFKHDWDQTNEGLVFAYYGSAAGPSLTHNWLGEVDQEGSGLGYTLFAGGDVNGDGYEDLAIGAPWFDNGQYNEGRINIYYGALAGLPLTPSWWAESNIDNSRLSAPYPGMGDFNGDGFDDLLVGSETSNSGTAQVHFGASTGPSAIPDWTAVSGQSGASMTYGTPRIADFNCDGVGDVVVGAPYYDRGQSNEGVVFVWYGTPVCTGCSIDGDDYLDGDTNPKNICQICLCALSESGWSNNNGEACDDGLYCNGDDVCSGGDCAQHTGLDCDDGLFCNGPEACDESADQCVAGTPPCPDDGFFCNGDESCAENSDACVSAGNPCFDDGYFCNGGESCDEISDACVSAGNPCFDDGYFCNGDESCDEDSDACISAGNPCAPDEFCSEPGDRCVPSNDLAPDPPDDDGSLEVPDSDDDDDSGEENDEDQELWPQGQITGGCCGC
jgi:FG-GAP repeat/FG-GAP-like repeat